MKIDFDLIKAILSMGAAGGYLLHSGLEKYKLFRLVEDTPTSNIKTAAVGNYVEIFGQVIAPRDEEVEAPLSGKLCSYFIWKVERLESNGKRSRWVNFHTTYSSSYLYVKDSSGCIAAISLSDIEGEIGIERRRVEFSNPSDLPSGLEQYYSKTHFRKWFKSFLGLSIGKYRLIEKTISHSRPLYAIGFADTKNKLQPVKFSKKKSFHDRILPTTESKNTAKEIFFFSKNRFIEMQKQISFVLRPSFKDKWRLFQLNKVYISQKGEGEFISTGRIWAFLKVFGGMGLCAGSILLTFFSFFK